MPTHKVKPETYGVECAPQPGKSKKHYPTVWIKASPEIIAALEVGEAATVTLKGVVVGLSSNTSQDQDRHEFTLELREVSAYKSAEKHGAADMKDAIDSGLGYGKKKDA